MRQSKMELVRMRLAEPLECGMVGCAESASSGLLEPDPQTRGLWRLLPVCGVCSAALGERSAPGSAPRPSRPGRL